MPNENDSTRYVHQALKILAFTVLLAGTAGASAQSSESQAAGGLVPDVRPMNTVRASAFTILDINGDGYLTRDEVEDPVTRSQFPSLDRNHDGRLDRAEYSGMPQ